MTKLRDFNNDWVGNNGHATVQYCCATKRSFAASVVNTLSAGSVGTNLNQPNPLDEYHLVKRTFCIFLVMENSLV